MKRLLISLLAMLMVTITCNAQGFGIKKHFKNVYTKVCVLTLENAPTPFPREGSESLIELPKESKFVIAFNADSTKAIVLNGGYMFGMHKEFSVKNNEARLVLFHKDKHVYCGYIYDKKAKAGKYFEAINENEKEKLVEKLPFLKRLPTFIAE